MLFVGISSINQSLRFFCHCLLCLVSSGFIVVLNWWVKLNCLSSSIWELKCVDSWWTINCVDACFNGEGFVWWVKECKLSVCNSMEAVGPQLSWHTHCSILENYWILQVSVVKSQVWRLSYSPKEVVLVQDYTCRS